MNAIAARGAELRQADPERRGRCNPPPFGPYRRNRSRMIFAMISARSAIRTFTKNTIILFLLRQDRAWLYTSESFSQNYLVGFLRKMNDSAGFLEVLQKWAYVRFGRGNWCGSQRPGGRVYPTSADCW